MSAPRRTPWLFLLALPVWLAIVVPGAAQTLTADIDGDGISDRIEGGGAAGGLQVRLSGPGPVQRLQATGTILDVAFADIDQDGDADLVATTTGRRHVRLLVWTNTGSGRFESRPRGRPRAAVLTGHGGMRVPYESPVLEDLAGGPDQLVTLPPQHGRRRILDVTPLAVSDEAFSTRPRTLRPAPRGPPRLQLLP